MARTGYGKHSTQVDTSQYPDDPSVPIGSDEWNAEPSDSGMLGFTSETISSASSITPSNTVINISGSTNVSTISQGNTNEYDLLYVFTSGTVTLEHGTGNIQLLGGSNKDLSSTVPTILMRKGSSWYEYGGSGTVEMGGTMTSHIIPDTNASYDLGNAEYKIRHLFLSDNSLWVGDDHKVEVQGGKMKFKKRKKNTTPTSIENAGGNSAGALSSSGRASLDQMTLNDWVVYGKSLGGSLANATPSDIYGSEIADDWDSDDSVVTDVGDKSLPNDTTIANYTTPTAVTTNAGALESSVTTFQPEASAGDPSWTYGFTNYGGYSVLKTWNIVGNPYVQSIRANWRTASGHYGSVKSGYEYSTDNGSTWIEIASVTTPYGGSWSTVDYTLTGVNATVTNIRLWGDKFQSANYGTVQSLGNAIEFTGYAPMATTNVFDDNTSTQFETQSLANCWINCDMGSSTRTSQIAIYHDSTNTTETEYQIQTSDDSSTWTTVRTITVSNLVDGQWNYINFNVGNYRYVRVYGSSGSAGVIATHEIKVKNGITDTVMIDNHKHVGIDSTDTTLGLDGT